MKSIREKVQTDYPKSDILEEEMTRICYRVGFEKGANYVLEEMENFMKGLDLGNSAEEKFYKLDVLADIGLFIEQLKK